MSGSDQTEFDMGLRRWVYRRVVDEQRAPTVGEASVALGVSDDEAADGFERLAVGRMLVLEGDTREIRMAMPFSAVETDYVVTSGGRRWWANCAWDALAIGVVVERDIRIEARCGDCGEAMVLEVTGGRLSNSEWVVHFAVPASRWWEDVVFT